MIPTSIEEITEENLQELVDNRIQEGKQLEYKRELSLDYNGHGEKFLAELTSFANTGGGDLIIGMDEDNDTSEPELYPLDFDNIDEEISRWESVLRTGVQPRLPSYQIEPVTISDDDGTGGTVLVIRVRQSQIGPHRVVRNSHNEFYGRNSNGKYPLDVDELRQQFLLSESLADDIREFRIERTAKIRARNTPVDLEPGPVWVIHLVPLTAFSPGSQLDLNSVEPYNLPGTLQRGRASGDASRYNIDGAVTYWQSSSEDYWGYTQTFRNGVIESVDAFFLHKEGTTDIPQVAIKETLTYTLSRHLEFLQARDIQPPLFLFMSMLDAEGYHIDRPLRSADPAALDRDMAHFPELVIDEYGMEISDIVDGLMGRLRNACGLQSSHTD